MEDILDFVVSMTSLDKVIWVLAVLSFVWILETGFPRFKMEYNKIKHDGQNLIYMLFLLILNGLIGIATVGLYLWVESNEIGLLHLFDLPIWMELLIAIMALDMFSQYWAHFSLHKFKWLWKLHMVHHSDTKVDATTGTRMHPGEYIIRESFVTITVIAIGIPVAFYAIYRVLSIFFSYWTHGNIALPLWLEKALSLVFITPNIHKFHHHFERPWTDSNFGNMFSFWDRIFGTFVNSSVKDIKYGLDVLDDKDESDMKYQLGLPFNKNVKTDY